MAPAAGADASLIVNVIENEDADLRKEGRISEPSTAGSARDKIHSSVPIEKDEKLEEAQDGSYGEGDNDRDNGIESAEAKAFEPLGRQTTHTKDIWKFRLRPEDDEDPQDWWFASTAIPLLAATIGPLANVMSIAALVTSWRMDVDPTDPIDEDNAVGFADPDWCVNLNIASLVCGFVGNIFLLFNFTKRIRYIVALPATIILWMLATGILAGITIAMDFHAPVGPNQIYSQGFWHAIIAAVLYCICALLLIVNMLGYFLGHYPQHFELDEEQRNLILQTMMFFVWLAGGAGVFSRTVGFQYVDALYFCDVTILTIGFGDFFATNDVGRGLVFPYSVGGIIILGLMVSSIRKFALQLGHDKVVKRHIERRRTRTLERSVTTSFEAQRREDLEKTLSMGGPRPEISGPFDPQRRTIAFDPTAETTTDPTSPRSPYSTKSHRSWYSKGAFSPMKSPISWASSVSEKMSNSRRRPIAAPFGKIRRITSRKTKLVILREEKDRFDAMREIQYSTRRFKRYFALSMSVIAFGILWCVGAVGFWQAEAETQGLSYFQALYFCYVSLLTIGYGDLSPKSNAGKPFFIVWSLVAVPTMTILISDMGDTVVAAYKRGTFTLADWSVLPKQGLLRNFLEANPNLMAWTQRQLLKGEEKRRISEGFPTGDQNMRKGAEGPTLETLADEDALDEHDLARKLTTAIRRTADDLRHGHHRRYSYEEWVEYTRLIRFTQYEDDPTVQLHYEEADLGIVEWDWIGENSPMMSDASECEWVLDRLVESLDRYMRKQVPTHVKERRRAENIERRRSTVASTGSFDRRRRSTTVGRDSDAGLDVSRKSRDSRRATESNALAPVAYSGAGRSTSASGRSTLAALRLKQK